jgi:hypothetical protein
MSTCKCLHIKKQSLCGLKLPYCIFSHIDWPIDAVKFDVKAACITDERARLVPPPHGRLLSVAVRANWFRPGAWTSGGPKPGGRGLQQKQIQWGFKFWISCLFGRPLEVQFFNCPKAGEGVRGENNQQKVIFKEVYFSYWWACWYCRVRWKGRRLLGPYFWSPNLGFSYTQHLIYIFWINVS